MLQNQIKQIPLRLVQAFNLPNVPDTITVPGRDVADRCHLTPTTDPLYHWEKARVQLMRAFFMSNDIGMRLYGHMGSGKTSVIKQFHAALNLPLYFVSCHRDMEWSDLMGQYVLDKGVMTFQEGPLLRAAREGNSVLLDESNTMRPGVATGLNGILEGQGIFIPQTGEVVTPAPGFRVFATGNYDQGSGTYKDRYSQDGAHDERWWHVWVDYLTPEEELPLVIEVYKAAGFTQDQIEQPAKAAIEVANTIRARFVEEDDSASALEVTMSTRTLLNWIKKSILFQGCEKQAGEHELHVALRYCLTNRPMSETSRIAIHNVVKDKFGFAPKGWVDPNQTV